MGCKEMTSLQIHVHHVASSNTTSWLLVPSLMVYTAHFMLRKQDVCTCSARGIIHHMTMCSHVDAVSGKTTVGQVNIIEKEGHTS